MGTIIVGIILLAVVINAIRVFYKQMKRIKKQNCTVDCKNCKTLCQAKRIYHIDGSGPEIDRGGFEIYMWPGWAYMAGQRHVAFSFDEATFEMTKQEEVFYDHNRNFGIFTTGYPFCRICHCR